MADFIFNGQDRIIQEPAGSGDTVFQVSRDLYSAWKRWVQIGDGAQWIPAFSIEGGTPIGSTGLFTGVTFLMINGWKIKPSNHDHQVILNGNLFSSDGIVTVPADTANATVFVNSSVAAQGIATGSGVPADVQSKIEELWQMRGLDNSNPVTVTPAQEISGEIVLDITGDGETTSTATRQP